MDISVIKMIISVAVWRIYPSWVNDKLRVWEGLGHSRMFWASLSTGAFGKIFVWSSKLSLFCLDLCSFRRVFCFLRFCKIWRQTFEHWGFWFRRCLGALFDTPLGHQASFPNSDYDLELSILKGTLSFFQSRAGVTCLTAMVIPWLSKAFWWRYVEN